MPAMDAAERQATLWGIGFAALLHLGLLVFLLLATISCNTWERAIDAIGLPKAWNPVTCNKPLDLAGPVIKATLMGPAGAPLPPPKKVRASRPKAPPPKVDVAKPKPVPVKTLPPPPKHPDTHDQAKVVAISSDKAQQAQHEQRQREQQHMSELDAQSNADIDKLFKQMDAAGQQSQRADRQAQKLAQLDDLKKSDAVPTTAPRADQARSGAGGRDNSLEAQYKAAITSKMIQSWHRPADLQSVVCHLHAVQIPGGTVISASVTQPCNADAQTRKSIENAAMRASPLPYERYEKVFRRDIYVEFCYPKEVCSQ
jgi:colicin import membrane protein